MDRLLLAVWGKGAAGWGRAVVWRWDPGLERMEHSPRPHRLVACLDPATEKTCFKTAPTNDRSTAEMCTTSSIYKKLAGDITYTPAIPCMSNEWEVKTLLQLCLYKSNNLGLFLWSLPKH